MRSVNEKRERNIELATRALLGESPKRLAQEYGVCAANSYRIVRAHCFRIDREVYNSLRNGCFGRPKLKDLREHIDVFLNDESGESITLCSPLWRINYGANKIVNILRPEGIHTIEDLLKFESDKLIKIPCVGPVILKELNNIIEQYRYLLDGIDSSTSSE
jgi:adenine-specific DNA methylase